jgi:uncharacterized DUF497 family protein
MGKTIISADGRFERDEEKSETNRDFIILYLAYTEPASGRTRIISARPAEPIEEETYYE